MVIFNDGDLLYITKLQRVSYEDIPHVAKSTTPQLQQGQKPWTNLKNAFFPRKTFQKCNFGWKDSLYTS